jgi:hypothetical protein
LALELLFEVPKVSALASEDVDPEERPVPLVVPPLADVPAADEERCWDDVDVRCLSVLLVLLR